MAARPGRSRKGELNVVSDTGPNFTIAFRAAHDNHFTERPIEMMTKSPDPHNMRYRDITRYITAIERSGGDANLSRVERALKIAVPVTCIIIALFGAPLATSTQRGGGAYGIAVSLATTMIFLLMIQLTQSHRRQRRDPARLRGVDSGRHLWADRTRAPRASPHLTGPALGGSADRDVSGRSTHDDPVFPARHALLGRRCFATSDCARISSATSRGRSAIPRPTCRRRSVRCSTIGVDSVPLTVIVAAFIGGVIAIQTRYQLLPGVQLSIIGLAARLMLMLELGPLLTGLVLTGRVGGRMTAEIGTMRVTEQIDALETLAYDPVAFLIVPRLLAATIMLPILVVLADAVGLTSAYIVASEGHRCHRGGFHHRPAAGIRDVSGGVQSASRR